MTKPSPDVYQLKITLLGTKPPIWRRLLVPSNSTFENLHRALQIAMGWQDYHLHQFTAGRRHIGVPDPDARATGMHIENERKVRLSDAIPETGSKILYTYDFGDSWDHSIVLEKVLPWDPTTAYPVCLGGKLAGPPEDCGGIPGFYNLLETLADPDSEEHESMLTWVGEGYDPKEFSIDDVNKELAPARPRAISRKP
jgi:hypothetical protein